MVNVQFAIKRPPFKVHVPNTTQSFKYLAADIWFQIPNV